jgi:cyanophycinase
MKTTLPLSCLLLVLFCFPRVSAQEFDERYSDWPEDLKINGQIIINHGLDDFERVRPYLRGLVRAKQVVWFDSVELGETPNANSLMVEIRAGITDAGNFSRVESGAVPVELLKTALKTADVVAIGAISSSGGVSQVEAIAGLSSEITRFVARGGVLIADASWAECLSECYLPAVIPDSDDEGFAWDPIAGMNQLPNCILRCVREEPQVTTKMLLQVLFEQSRAVGVVLEPTTMLVLAGRKMFCFGEGKATFCLPATEQLEARVESITEQRSRRQPPWNSLVDLTEWRRDSIDRTLEPFPPKKPRTPVVKEGTLLIVGGGGMPKGLMDRFVELAGGPEKAKLVYVPCSEADDVGEQQRTVQQWQQMGVQHATFIHTKDRRKADNDDVFLEPLKDATGIWFGGGRQWNFADSYYGTTAHELMKKALLRGGVVGGSSAGASIQARYLARATPIGNYRIMAPGYERGGLGFISGVAIDQHFTQRGRQKDMTELMRRHPQLLGIGLDEATAIEVQKSQARVIGQGRVFFYDRTLPVVEGEPDYIALPAGSVYDLAKRAVVVDKTETGPETKAEAK